jgi:hypothetical protein
VFVRISLNGGKTWVDGTRAGTPLMNRSKKFALVPDPPSRSGTTPTIELSDNQFLTAYHTCDPCPTDSSAPQHLVKGYFWYLENSPSN